MKNEWDIDAAIATYNVDAWGGGYFTVNSEGNVVAKPLQNNGGSINIPPTAAADPEDALDALIRGQVAQVRVRVSGVSDQRPPHVTVSGPPLAGRIAFYRPHRGDRIRVRLRAGQRAGR